jgi:hypothetical protein
MEPTTRGHSSSLGPGILQKRNPGSQILTPAAPRWCMNGGGSVATSPLIIRYIIIAFVLKRRCWSVSQFRWFSIVVTLLVFLRRNLSSCPANIRTECYITFVRPQLEYASSVWAPHTQSNINKLESVQRSITGLWMERRTLCVQLFCCMVLYIYAVVLL